MGQCFSGGGKRLLSLALESQKEIRGEDVFFYGRKRAFGLSKKKKKDAKRVGVRISK